MAWFGGKGSAEAKERLILVVAVYQLGKYRNYDKSNSLLLFLPRSSALPVPPHRAIAEEKQKIFKIAHIM